MESIIVWMCIFHMNRTFDQACQNIVHINTVTTFSERNSKVKQKSNQAKLILEEFYKITFPGSPVPSILE